jgi:hypothetical protein
MDRSSDPDEDSPQPGQVILLKELLDLAPRADVLDSQLVVLTILAGLVALGGLFLNSIAVIIGAMGIYPPAGTHIDGIPQGGVNKIKETIKSTSTSFSARFMVKEYVNKYYPSLLTC